MEEFVFSANSTFPAFTSGVPGDAGGDAVQAATVVAVGYGR